MPESSESSEAAAVANDSCDRLDVDGAIERHRHLIVGIGASAGGLSSFKSLFTAMPVNSGIAFVLVQHLDPDYDSNLAEIIGDCTSMPVRKATDGDLVLPNTVSVIPPNAIIKIEGGALRVAKAESTNVRRSSIDIFLLSLAEDQGENAVGIILSGFGSDGTVGIAAIKAAGGLTLSEAEFDHHAKKGMPESASAGGFVDDVLKPADMPAALIDYQQARNRMASNQTDPSTPDLARSLVTICDVLHSRLGRDFGQYKASTMMRRIRRRMEELRIDDPESYIEQLRTSAVEPDLLFREILISVTRFFRDPAIFDAIAENVLPALVANGTPDTPIRIWVAGTATGEEAYSLAILVNEACSRAETPRRVSIFATDIDDRAVTFARAGMYSDAIEADIDAARLEKHFNKEGSRYRVAKHIREMCVFSTHDLVKDPPFSNLDLISCRNLLIYFDAALQQRVIAAFHYGLKQDGVLLLGPTETISSNGGMFKPVDKRSRIYRRLDGTGLPRPLLAPKIAIADIPPVTSAVGSVDEQAARMVAQYTPAYIIVDGNLDVQRFSGPVAKFLEPMSGSASFNLFRLLHTELRAPARVLLRQAADGRQRVEDQVAFKVVGRPEIVNLIAEPMSGPLGDRPNILLAFQEVAQPLAMLAQIENGDRPVSHAEYQAARDQLRTVTDELETANEELQSSNEEFQSVNEELKSAVEELETSKEELQSINEELQTVNAELNSRAESLIRSNSDLANLFDSTSVATLFLDNSLNIRRFTPAVTDIFNLREGDEGRPIGDFSSILAGEPLSRDASIVLRDLSTIEREVVSSDGKSTYLLRIRPYRDLNNVIDGVSITLFDISDRKRLERDRAHLAAIVASSEDGIVSHDLNGLITSWNSGAEKIYGYSSAEVMGQPMSKLLGSSQINEWPSHLARLRKGEVIANLDVSRKTKDDGQIDVSLNISPVRSENGTIVGASAIARDITQRKAAEERSQLLMAELDHRVKNILSVVSLVVTQTLRSGAPLNEVADQIEGRITAIARAHNLLSDQGGVRSSLSDLVSTELRPFDQRRTIKIAGPVIRLTSRASLSLTLAFHELTTNAAKYGCLSVDGGSLDVTWKVTGPSDHPLLKIEWIETGGPRVSTPSRQGFGTKLIEVSLVRGLGAEVERKFLKAGVRCRIDIPLTPDVGSVGPDANTRDMS